MGTGGRVSSPGMPTSISVPSTHTSALDYESERVIQENMAAICKGRTVFIIAHRLSTVRHCDRIIVLEKGRVIENGTHDELLKQNGQYALLHAYQNHTPAIRTVANDTSDHTTKNKPKHGHVMQDDGRIRVTRKPRIESASTDDGVQS